MILKMMWLVATWLDSSNGYIRWENCGISSLLQHQTLDDFTSFFLEAPLPLRAYMKSFSLFSMVKKIYFQKEAKPGETFHFLWWLRQWSVQLYQHNLYWFTVQLYLNLFLYIEVCRDFCQSYGFWHGCTCKCSSVSYIHAENPNITQYKKQ